ncbi:D-alanyl-D-alanine carboxypeptidase family protein [Amnibacterium kyonggiense]|uniref:D-alanyl-D-alanine carboxypeptidase (Penicillin-binding protein 5/6) n=1 Tax=Amnibacterium kyonggiense TaxID=595671 RepID=A0A4R7FLQ0_9MICO|nr:D-alanyl-D-alanine carboxypeptidase [Amnibacterium kyonggiense]TDS77345.1 D-alanyl-D-alanine carboxypeptidase (penicillin-binding protein 5/6) [Amnibacterium kyonggiense]
MPRQESPSYGLRRFVAAVSATLILLIGVGVPVSIVAPVPQARAEVAQQIQQDTGAAAIRLPSFGSSAVGVVGMSGVLAKRGPQAPRQMASITKVITMLVVLEKKPLAVGEDGPTITLGQRDVGYLNQVIADNGSWQPVQPGWKLSQRAAIETTMIPSANNYAESLAVWAYGSVPAFLTAARAFLEEHHLDDTTIVDTNGLSSQDRSTPTDLVDLGRLALANPVLAATVRMATADEPNVGELQNTNELLGTDGIDGLKTGTYDTGANLLFSATRTIGDRSVRIVGVVLGAVDHPTLDARVPAVIDSVVAGFHDLELAKPGQVFATYETRWGGVGRAVAAKEVSRVVWSRAQVVRTASVRDITGGQKGEQVGKVVYTVDGQRVEIPLVLDRDVLAAPVWWRLTHPLR